MPEIPRTKFNSPWTVENIEAELNGTKNARGNLTMTEKLATKQDLLVVGTNLDAVPTAGSVNPVTSGGVQAPMEELVDAGAKNMSQFNSGTAAADNTTIATGVPLIGHSGDELVFSYETALSSGIVTIGFKDANDSTTGSTQIGNASKIKEITIPENTVKFNVFVSKAGTYSSFMICTKAAWDISHAYQPYRPSWQEMYERIVALESGGNRALTMQMQPTEPEEQEER